MKKVIISILFFAVGLGLSADDWPQWRGPTRDGILPAKGIMLTKLPDQPKVVWKIKSGEGLSSPVVYLRERSPRQDARPLGPSPCRDL